jgi:hypothetical protein
MTLYQQKKDAEIYDKIWRMLATYRPLYTLSIGVTSKEAKQGTGIEERGISPSA